MNHRFARTDPFLNELEAIGYVAMPRSDWDAERALTDGLAAVVIRWWEGPGVDMDEIRQMVARYREARGL
jgi:hypothetical protein